MEAGKARKLRWIRKRRTDRVFRTVENVRRVIRYHTNPEYAEAKREALRQRRKRRRRNERRLLLERDGDVCAWCSLPLGDPFDTSEVHVDHRVPISRGGSNALKNLNLLHARCNASKGPRSMSEAPALNA